MSKTGHISSIARLIARELRSGNKLKTCECGPPRFPGFGETDRCVNCRRPFPKAPTQHKESPDV